MQRVRLSTRGPWCHDCSALVEKTVEDMPGIVGVTHDEEAGFSEIAFDEAEVGREHILEALREAGFGSELPE